MKDKAIAFGGNPHCTENSATGMSGHSTVPWHVVGLDPRSLWIESDNGNYVAEIDRKNGSLEQVANARLIAAAPELLEACKLAIKDSRHLMTHRGIAAVEAAIAKATQEAR